MGVTLLGLVAIAYGAVAWNYASQGRWGMCLAFIGYLVANVGFMWDMRLWEGR